MFSRSESMTFNTHLCTIDVQFKYYFKYINYSAVKVILCVYIGLEIITQQKLAKVQNFFNNIFVLYRTWKDSLSICKKTLLSDRTNYLFLICKETFQLFKSSVVLLLSLLSSKCFQYAWIIRGHCITNYL